MRALVLAAGLGTRLRPLTDSVPKPLAPVAGRPVVEHLLARLPSCGVEAAVFNLHHLGGQIRARLGAGERFGLPLGYSREPELLGTAGSLRGAHLLLGDGDVLVVSGDGLHDVDLRQVVERHRASGAAATITVRRLAEPWTCALVELDERGLVTRFVEKPPRDEVFTDLASIGIYCFSKAARELVPPGPFDIASELIPLLLERGLPVAAVQTDAWWSDIGTLAELLRANLAVAGGELKTIPIEGEPVILADDTVLDPTATIAGRAVIGPDCEVGPGAHVQDAVILPGASVPSGTLVAGGLFGEPAAVEAAWAT